MTPVRPILVVMSYRGGERLRRCLDSVEACADAFSRIVVSVTAESGSPDDVMAREFAGRHSHAEALCTGRELPTLAHQAFWVTHLEHSGATPDDWILWLAYDDEVRPSGIQAIAPSGAWPLETGTAYFGPWAMRHERAEALFDGPRDEPLESWTSFPLAGPLRLPVPTWIANQLAQPTYMQMSGSVCRFASYLELRDGRPTKSGPMRIEMAIAATAANSHVQEFTEPVTIIYGRPNSDRASYGGAARREDAHLGAWLVRYAAHRPSQALALVRGAGHVAAAYAGAAIGRRTRVTEDWVVRGMVQP